MANEMHKYHLMILDQSHGKVAHAIDAISLQSINSRYFTINSEDTARPTYVEIYSLNPDLVRGPIAVFIRTKRGPIQGNRNLEPSLQEILDEFKASLS